MVFKTEVMTEFYGHDQSLKDIKHRYQWVVEMIPRMAVGVNLSVVPSVVEELWTSYEDEDGKEHDVNINTMGFERKVEYESLESNSIGTGLHLGKVSVYINRKEIVYTIYTNNF